MSRFPAEVSPRFDPLGGNGKGRNVNRRNRMKSLLIAAGAAAWIIGATMLLARVDVHAGACDSWTARGEEVYVSAWQREHCTSIRIREIPMTAEYNP